MAPHLGSSSPAVSATCGGMVGDRRLGESHHRHNGTPSEQPQLLFNTPEYRGNKVPAGLRGYYAYGSPYDGRDEGNIVYQEAKKAQEKASLKQLLIVLIVTWYGGSTVNNIVEKAVLDLADAPLTLGCCQMFGTATISYLFLCATAKHNKAENNKPDFYSESRASQSTKMQSLAAAMRIMPIALCVAGMRGLHNVALGVVSLKLLQTVKCTAPVLNVAMQKVLYGKNFPTQTYVALLIISVGIVLTCGTELEISALGVITGVLSTFMQNLQTIFGKNLLDDGPETRLSEMELQYWTCLMSTLFYLPMWFLSEGFAATANAPGIIYVLLGAAGCFYFLQSWVALKVLSLLDGALTHTIASTFKRVVLIVFSALWFGNRVSPLNALGISLAIGGLFYYNYTKSALGLRATKGERKEVLPGGR